MRDGAQGARSYVVGVNNAAVGVLCHKALFEAHIGEITSSRATIAEDGQRHFHTTILGGIADVTKHRHAFELVDTMDLARFCPFR
jgi:hypothetical protein